MDPGHRAHRLDNSADRRLARLGRWPAHGLSGTIYAPLNGALFRYAHGLAAWGRATGALQDEASPPAFVDEITATLLLGMAAPGGLRQDGYRIHPTADDQLGAATDAAPGSLAAPALERQLDTRPLTGDGTQSPGATHTPFEDLASLLKDRG